MVKIVTIFPSPSNLPPPSPSFPLFYLLYPVFALTGALAVWMIKEKNILGVYYKATLNLSRLVGSWRSCGKESDLVVVEGINQD
jgi:hypothetical protein